MIWHRPEADVEGDVVPVGGPSVADLDGDGVRAGLDQLDEGGQGEVKILLKNLRPIFRLAGPSRTDFSGRA